MKQAEQLPRVFQANTHRLFVRILAPVMDELPVHELLVIGITTSMDEFLDRCAAQVDNYTANEAHKVFALVLIALFERQVRLWAELNGIKVKKNDGFLSLVDAAAAGAGIDLKAHGLRSVIEEAFELGNVVRHGEGRALNELKKIARHHIDRTMTSYIDLLPQESPDSEWVKLSANDVRRYANAFIRFWGLADQLPCAVLEMPPSLP